ncbi:energy-coupled thiamine transporter ThiT [Spiroplasma diminutum]|uniref:Transmembrane protein n=1 Tax=Spiroplasma diminutum CUAS-1 TaxID=1276221 RepID=S5LVR9_9MOLU|nr:energy-coupled thiamine transporter ThiT [Spiroplasma diminutum]AGR41929.1 hypothetical protein SDIMI_v3c02250 [Spiroplasma diminutum CUAS-1]
MNKKLFKTSIILSSLRILLILSLLIWANIAIIESGSNNTNMPINKIITIVICFSLLSFLFIMMNFSLLLNYKFDENNTNIKIILTLSVLTFNIELFIAYVNKVKVLYKPFTFKKWTIFDITSISLLLALYFTVGFVTGLIPPLPFYITLTFKYIPLFFGAFILSLSGCITLCFLAASLTALMPGSYFSFWQFVFDFWLPTFLIFIANFFVPNIKSKKGIFRIALWFAFITIPVIILYFSRVISGVVYWLNPSKLGYDPSKEFDWSNNVGYSFIYNSINTIFDYTLLMLTVPLICESLLPIKERYFSINT